MVTRFLAVACLLIVGLHGASAAAEHVESLELHATVASGGRVTVEELWTYDFAGSRRHFVEREISRGRFTDGSRVGVSVRVLEVTDAGGARRPYELEETGRSLIVRVGDPDIRSTGRHSIRIVYELGNAVDTRPDGQEVLLDLSGRGWRVPITTVRARVDLPDGSSVLRTGCLLERGPERDPACTDRSEGASAFFESTRPLRPSETMQVAVAVPRGTIKTAPVMFRALLAWVRSVGRWVLVPAVVLLVLAWFVLNRREEERLDDTPRPPVRLGPAEVGTVFDARVDSVDFAATVLDLARRGHLSISKVPREHFHALTRVDWELVHLPDGDALRSYEVIALAALFGGSPSRRVSDVRSELPARMPEFRREVYKELRTHGRAFTTDPERLKARFSGAGFVCVAAAILGWAFSEDAFASASMATAVLLFVGTRVVPVRTARGLLARAEVQAFRRFISESTSEQLQVQDLLDRQIFESLLPYATVLGVADRWAMHFAQLWANDPPEWLSCDGDPLSDLGEFLRELKATAAGLGEESDDGRHRGRYVAGELSW